MATEYERGHTVKIGATLKDADDTLVDPDQVASIYQMTCEIKNAITGTAKVTATTMTRSATGTFHYYWQTTESLDVGQYEIEIVATYNNYKIVNRDYIDLVLVV